MGGPGPGIGPGPAQPMNQGGWPRPAQAGGGGYAQHAPATGQIAQPPYLASQTAARMTAPEEPWAESLTSIMLVFGILLVACFVLPWSLGEKMAFSWDMIRSAPDGKAKLLPLLIGGTGLLSVVLALLPLTVSVRGVAAAFIGLVPLGLMNLFVDGFEWRGLLVVAALITLIPGLLVRSQYHGSLTARVMVTIGVSCALLPLLVPSNDQIPLIEMFKAIGSAPGKAKVTAVLRVVWLLIAVSALLAWLPPPGSAGAHILAWMLIAQAFIDPLIRLFIMTPPGALATTIKGGLFVVLWLPIVLTAWFALTGYGTASIVGKSLEQT